MHIVGKENMEVFLSKLHYLWNVISLLRIFTSFFLLLFRRLTSTKANQNFITLWFFLTCILVLVIEFLKKTMFLSYSYKQFIMSIYWFSKIIFVNELY